MRKSDPSKWLFLGFDPGQTSGGFGWIHGDRYGATATGRKSPQTLRNELAKLIRARKPPAIGAGVERVGPRKGEGAKSAFGFGKSLGVNQTLACCLEWLGVPVDVRDISVQSWQTEFGLWGGWNSVPEKKRGHIHVAANLFPCIDVRHHSADALLICAFTASKIRRCELPDVFAWR